MVFSPILTFIDV